MKSIWIFAVLLGCFSADGLRGRFSSNDNLDRIYYEMQNLDELYAEHIKKYKNLDAEEMKDLKAVDIVRKVWSLNDLGISKDPPSSCPTYKDSNDIYTIKVRDLKAFEVLCNSDIAGPGWTVVASRSGPAENFLRGWQDYKMGFGNITGDFFIGLEKLHKITVAQPQQLYIYLEDFDGNKRFAKYNDFLIGTESNKYMISQLDGYAGDMGDSLRGHKQRPFSTYDNCAINSSEYIFIPARQFLPWWHNSGFGSSNLFGMYQNGTSRNMEYTGMFWKSWRGSSYSYKLMRMMVKPKCFCASQENLDGASENCKSP